jgi:predicted transcriptional regulator
MIAGTALREARRRKGLSQRALGELTGIPQPTIARIETGLVSPRLRTLARLLEACDEEIRIRPRRGAGVDISMSRELAKMSPRQRVKYMAEAAESVARTRGRAR